MLILLYIPLTACFIMRIVRLVNFHKLLIFFIEFQTVHQHIP